MGAVSLEVKIGPLQIRNPAIAASGCYGYGQDYIPWVSPERWGAIVVKGTSLTPRRGNRPPRLVETPSGLLNSIGLQNPGVDAFLNEELPRLKYFAVPILVNIFGETPEEYARLAEKLEGVEGVAGLEVNISCPNVEQGGLLFGCDPYAVKDLVYSIRSRYSGLLMVKIAPLPADPVEIALASEEGGADAVSLINTVKAMVIDVDRQEPFLSAVTGGLSGPAILPIAVRTVWEAASRVNIPVIGMGGINCARDALQFILAGACAVQIGSANFVNPRVPMEVVEGIEEYMLSKGYENVEDMVGAARR